jgi:hypothetical protein
MHADAPPRSSQLFAPASAFNAVASWKLPGSCCSDITASILCATEWPPTLMLPATPATHSCRLLYILAFGTLLEMGIVVITLLHLVSSVKQPGQEHDVSGEVAMTAASLVLTLVTFALSMWGSGSAIVGARALVRRVADATSRRGSAISDAASRIQTTMGDVGPRRTSIADVSRGNGGRRISGRGSCGGGAGTRHRSSIGGQESMLCVSTVASPGEVVE